MDTEFDFLFYSLALGLSLSADAFSVSLANGLSNQRMEIGKMCLLSAPFAIAQALMPFLGFHIVHIAAARFGALQTYVPFLSAIILVSLGIKMLYGGLRKRKATVSYSGALTPGGLFLQALATSVDALSAGIALSNVSLYALLVSLCIIATVTFLVCLLGHYLGTLFGTRLTWSAEMFGGAILLLIAARTIFNAL